MSKEITKDELKKRISELEIVNKDLESRDSIVRTNISQFLGSVRIARYSWDDPQVRTLKWSEIYFELGKIMADRARVENLTEIKNQIEHLMNLARREDPANTQKRDLIERPCL
jgi:chaperonin cofactor prefoldin